MRHVLATMPKETQIDRRNSALIAFAALTGARDAAIISAKLKHIDLAGRRFVQDAREVHTKFSKTFTTWFFPVGDDLRAVFEAWVQELTRDDLFAASDPVFPATFVRVDAKTGNFTPSGVTRDHWATAQPVRDIFRKAFEAAGLPYMHPHSFRHMLALHGERACGTVEEFKAWSQNLGHDGVLTTLTSYGTVPPHRQAELIRRMGDRERATA